MIVCSFNSNIKSIRITDNVQAIDITLQAWISRFQLYIENDQFILIYNDNIKQYQFAAREWFFDNGDPATQRVDAQAAFTLVTAYLFEVNNIVTGNSSQLAANV